MRFILNQVVVENKLSKIINSIIYHINYTIGKRINKASKEDISRALSLTVKDMIQDKLKSTQEIYKEIDSKKIYYISIEFLVGASLENNLFNLHIYDECEEALSRLGFNLQDVIEADVEPALGTGGLGRLAACFLDSMATLGIPGFGYGINYEFGSLKQEIKNGYQIEKPDDWNRDIYPFFIERVDEIVEVPVYGHVEKLKDIDEGYRFKWENQRFVTGIPYDLPIVGYGANTVNYLRLYTARASNKLDFEKFYYGNFAQATKDKTFSENISKIIYPSDSNTKGRELRLLQEYFLVACSLKDIINQYKKDHNTFEDFSSKVAIQINDTHPALAIAELMRILTDEIGMNWERAWETTTNTIGYTNHTLLPEALEKWSVSLLEKVVPLHMEIIYKINANFLKKVEAKWPGDLEKLRSMSLIEENETKSLRMTNLAIIGSHSVNGVAAVHSELIKTNLVPDFYQLWPGKFNNKTNGITQRRWLLKSNPELAYLITSSIGDGWITNLDKLKELENYSEDNNFQSNFIEIKYKNKQRLSSVISELTEISVDPDSIFDIQVKRIHEYKRQLLNAMNIIHTYLRIIEDGDVLENPRTFIFAGKSAPGYFAAKHIIKLINNLSKIINSDKRVKNSLKIVFIPNYRVKLAEIIFPAADVSEQISTAGKEASGTGNMKFALNGALTIGTLDGANIEIKEEVGEENIYIFGKEIEEIRKMQIEKSYNPKEIYEKNENIKRIMDSFNSDIFCSGETGIFKWIFESIMDYGDVYFHLADLQSYINTQNIIEKDFSNRSTWAKKAILNTARSGKFSSDRTISEYARDIWNVKSVIN